MWPPEVACVNSDFLKPMKTALQLKVRLKKCLLFSSLLFSNPTEVLFFSSTLSDWLVLPKFPQFSLAVSSYSEYGGWVRGFTSVATVATNPAFLFRLSGNLCSTHAKDWRLQLMLMFSIIQITVVALIHSGCLLFWKVICVPKCSQTLALSGKQQSAQTVGKLPPFWRS